MSTNNVATYIKNHFECMSKRMPKDLRYITNNVRSFVGKKSQKIPQKECQKIYQKIYQKNLIECLQTAKQVKMTCQIKKNHKEFKKVYQIESQEICDKECRKNPSEKMTRDMPERMSEDLLDDMSEGMSDRGLRGILRRMTKDISKRMFEDMLKETA